MKHAIAILLLTSSFTLKAQQHKLTRLWESSELAVPESVLPDLQKNILYTSLIDGGSSEADGKGGVGKLDLNGKIIEANWITGMNAPKGLGKFKDKLYVADLTDIKVIDINKQKVVSVIPAEGSVFLNDITVDNKGVVYVSDTRKGKVYRIINNKAEVWLENIDNANGLKAIGKDLYILSGKTLIKVDQKKEITKIAEGFGQNADGVEQLKNGDLIVTCWAGLIYYVSKNGQVQLLADFQSEKINTADLGLNPDKNIIYVPTFNKKSIIAFQIQ